MHPGGAVTAAWAGNADAGSDADRLVADARAALGPQRMEYLEHIAGLLRELVDRYLVRGRRCHWGGGHYT